MRIVKLVILLSVMVSLIGCTPLKKTGKFLWNAPGKVVSGVAQTGKLMWDVTPKSGPQLQETAKVIWGSSTKALENARTDAIQKTYRCSFKDCYESVLTLAHKEPVYLKVYDDEGKVVEGEKKLLEQDKGVFDVFIDNRAKRHLVVMGIRGNVDTTEVGIFFSQPSLTTVRLEVSSLSSNAKRTVAEAVFEELDLRFSAAE